VLQAECGQFCLNCCLPSNRLSLGKRGFSAEEHANEAAAGYVIGYFCLFLRFCNQIVYAPVYGSLLCWILWCAGVYDALNLADNQLLR